MVGKQNYASTELAELACFHRPRRLILRKSRTNQCRRSEGTARQGALRQLRSLVYSSCFCCVYSCRGRMTSLMEIHLPRSHLQPKYEESGSLGAPGSQAYSGTQLQKRANLQVPKIGCRYHEEVSTKRRAIDYPPNIPACRDFQKGRPISIQPHVFCHAWTDEGERWRICTWKLRCHQHWPHRGWQSQSGCLSFSAWREIMPKGLLRAGEAQAGGRGFWLCAAGQAGPL